MSFLTGTNCELIYASTSVGVSQASFTTEQQFNTTATMSTQCHLPPDFWLPNQNAIGRGIKIVARGTLAATATPTYTVTIRGGAAGNVTIAPILAGTATMVTVSGATTSEWTLEVDCILKAIAGAGGNSTLFSYGEFNCPGIALPPTANSNNEVIGGLTTAGTLVAPGTITTLDTSITNYINFNAACSASAAGNIFALKQLLVYGLN